MKKGMIWMLTLALVLVGFGLASAANNVASTSQKGSLLIFPKVDISGDRDTIIAISNDYYQAVNIKCYWVDYLQNVQDFMFKLTANQPAWFSAKSGLNNFDGIPVEVPPFNGPYGELKCWAVDAAGANQISWNHLYGTATVLDPAGDSAYEYNSWNFAARTGTRGDAIGTGGAIALDGTNYDACPQYLAFNFASVGGNFGTFGSYNTDLTLVPCKQDLRQDRKATYTKAKFDIWNENETKYTGTYQCIKCWFENTLDQIENGAQNFAYENLHTSAGRFRVWGVPSTVCKFPAPTVASPLLGLSVNLIDFDFDETYDALAGTTPNTAGVDPSGFVLWDPQSSIVPELMKR